MSLSVRQQRVLDGLAGDLQASEPHMASMFAIFTRLAKDEGPPPLRGRLRRARHAAGSQVTAAR